MTKSHESKNQIRYGALLSYVSIFINIITGLLYTPWIIRSIGNSEFGLYTLSISIITIFTFDFGLGEAVSRYLSKYHSENDSNAKSQFLSLVFRLYLFIDVIIFIALLMVFIFSENIYTGLNSSELTKFRITFIIAGIYAVLSFPFQPLNGILISHERFVLIKFLDIIQRILIVVLTIFMLINGRGLYSLIFINSAVGLFVILIKFIYLRKNQFIKLNLSYKNKQLLHEILKFTIWTSIAAVFSKFTYNITPTILGIFSNTQEVAIFGVASTIEGYVWLFASALNGLFMPTVMRLLNSENGKEKIQFIFVKIGKIQFIIIGLIIMGFFLIGEEFLTIWLGTSYIKSYQVILLLILPLSITLTQSIGSTYLVAKNLIKYRAYSVGITGSLSLLLSLFLTPALGSYGSAISILIGTVIGQIVYLNVIYSTKLELKIKDFFLTVFMKQSIVIILTSATFIIVNFNFKFNSYIFVLFNIFLITSIYVVLTILISINKKDLKLYINKILRRKIV
jgi:O-antigen/teichoic acid export membrane protein